ncbi:lymphocyte-specific helicase-like [Sycon ciliatum]|uniref:lymphocyte-specific helicase-like n=1 Tax=Sycon ciliatum TaxID=27933 RepID=UPI0020AEAA0B|eukprot:scpid27578/ scgid23006/ Lymphocyte-specific helicase; Proliferation-associated SNF2-like protein
MEVDTLVVPMGVPQAPESPQDEERSIDDFDPDDPTVTEEMAEEESALHEESGERATEEQTKVIAEYQAMETAHRRKRLNHLLEKSNLYAKFLLSRMERQLEADKNRRARKSEAAATRDVTIETAPPSPPRHSPATSHCDDASKTTTEPAPSTASSQPNATESGASLRRSSRRSKSSVSTLELTPSQSSSSNRTSPATSDAGTEDKPPKTSRRKVVPRKPSSPLPTPTSSQCSDEDETVSPSLRPSRKRRRPAHMADYKLADYLDHDSLSKRVKTTVKPPARSAKETKAADSEEPLTEAAPTTAAAATAVSGNQPMETASATATAASADDDGAILQPKLLSGGTLREYQLDGLRWLKVLYENGVNGILADEMGLGKTIQCISLITHLIEFGIEGPFLIAAPLSTLPNWVNEFKKFAPLVPICLYHGSGTNREQLRRGFKKRKVDIPDLNVGKVMPVIITSYEIIMRDRKFLQRWLWKYIIVDEGHRLKNLNCKLIRELKQYSSANRLLLTGTPLQNNVSELWSLLNFLLPDIFDDLSSFQSWFDFSDIADEAGKQRIIAEQEQRNVVDTLHQILTPFLLRRLKSDIELSIPSKKEAVVYAKLTDVQRTFSKALLAVSLKKEHENRRKPRRQSAAIAGAAAEVDDDTIEDIDLEEMIRKNKRECGVLAQSVVNLSLCNVHMQLRKCCNHPYLIEYPLDVYGRYRVDEEIVTSSGKMMVLDSLLRYLRSHGQKVLVFSQMTKMLDIVEDYAGMRSYSFCRLDGSVSLDDRQQQIKYFNEEPDAFLFLLSTRAGGLGINLTAANVVIIFDSDWNPQADLQAQDRCHRIGQTKPVTVLRLVAANSIDQHMVERAGAKRKLEKMIIHKGKFKGRNQDDAPVNSAELLKMLSSEEHDESMSSNANRLDDEKIAALLDHSSVTVAV